MPSEKSETVCYEHQIPPFVEAELDRLYGARFSSMRHFRIYGRLKNAHTYVRHAKGKPAAILLFRIEEQTVRVLNEAIRLSPEEIRQFADHIFLRYPKIRTVTFPVIEKEERCLSRPAQSVFYHSDMWLNVPGNADEYLKSLGTSTRQGIRRDLRKLNSSFPSFHYRFMEKEEVNEHDIRTIIGFNRAKLKTRGEISQDDENEIQRISALTRECGLVCIATIEGRVCGGTISYRLAANFAFRATGYDSAFESYRLGFLINFLTFCECIERGAKNIHLGWGTQDYKFRLGGIQRDFEEMIIFRSWGHFLLGWKRVLQATIRDSMVKTRRSVKIAATRRDGPVGVAAKTCIAAVRWLRQWK